MVWVGESARLYVHPDFSLTFREIPDLKREILCLEVINSIEVLEDEH